MSVPTPFQPPSNLKNARSNPLPTPLHPPLQPPSNPVFQPLPPKGGTYIASRPSVRVSRVFFLSYDKAAPARRVRRLCYWHPASRGLRNDKPQALAIQSTVARVLPKGPSAGNSHPGMSTDTKKSKGVNYA